MEAKRSNKIREIDRLQQMLRKWKRLAKNHNGNTTTIISSSNKSISFLKRTLSFSDSSDFVPKGFFAVCVGKELKRYVIPTQYLGHQAFGILLREAEEEFGFHQEGVLKIPCTVAAFEDILKLMQKKRDDEFFLHDLGYFQHHHSEIDDGSMNTPTINGCHSPDCCDLLHISHPQLCR